ncbi:MAG: hypothetical protein A2Z16_02650 [Chloroflexi bacterium RBG_16_54_18]|nr:MAG: hypothetical protein A2Z16_02650 [Chloroflexi bacterium RBG_16_54_18]
MWESLQYLDFNGFSFWIGFLAGFIFLLITKKIRTWLRSRPEGEMVEKKSPGIDPKLADILRLNNDTLQYAQSWHIAASMFPLDEILVEPRLLAPPVSPDKDPADSRTDITDWAIPYMPDWPEMGSMLGAPTLSLAEGFLEGCNIAITGQPGTGKTTALAWLAIQVIRKSTGFQEFEDSIPILVRPGDLALPRDETKNLLAPLLQAVTGFSSPGTRKHLASTLPALFENGCALLILDGLDELPPLQVNPYVEYLNAVRESYPKIRMAVSASPDYLAGLYGLDFFPFTLAAWSRARRQEFTSRWSRAWSKSIAEVKNSSKKTTDPWLLQGWLANEITPHSPLELTLRTWAAFAGDALGAQPDDAIEAHLRRLTCKLQPRIRPALEHMALQMVHYMQPIIPREEAEAWLSGSSSAPLSSKSNNREQAAIPTGHRGGDKESVKAPGSMPDLIEGGIVTEYAGGRVGICHTVIAGYLAGEALRRSGEGSQLVLQPDWCGKSLALKRYCSGEADLDFIDGILQTESADILLKGLLTTARWLKDAPQSVNWVKKVMSQLAACLQKEQLPFSLKGRALSALVLSGNATVQVLFRKMLDSPHNEIRQLGILGSGMQRDQRASPQLKGLLSDRSPHLRNAAVLSLVAIHDNASLDAVAEALLHGDEALRRACAEALSNDPEEGFPTLEEGSSHPDPLVRRSVVFGLRRVKQEWTIKILQRIRDDDTKWVVKDAAAQVLGEFDQLDPRIPHPLPAVTQLPWLIGFAADRNMVVPAGKAAVDLIHKALKEGNEEQLLSALHYLGFRGDEGSIAPVYQVYFTSKGEKREIASLALQRLASTGVSLPSPAYFGMA